MELRRYLEVVARWWWLLIISTLLAGAVAFFYTRTLPPVYRATALLFVNQVAAPGTLTLSDALLNQQLAKTYSQMMVQPVVLEEVIERLGLPLSATTVGRMVSASPVRDTQLLQITVEGSDPATIRDIANTLAQVFIARQAPYLPPGQTASALQVAQPALLPTQPIGPRVMFNTAVAALFGLLLALGVVAFLEYMDDTVKTPDEVEQATSLVTLGAVMRFSTRDGTTGTLLSTDHFRNPAFEAYRLVRTNLEFASVDRPLAVLLVTSASPGEGKSTTVANLAIALAQTGKRVIIVDADLRKPILHRLFEVPNKQGLTNLLLVEDGQVEQHLQAGPIEGLRVLPSGLLPPNPAELLTSPRMAALIERLKHEADIVILDSPPVLAVADAIVLASRVDGTLLVVDSQRTRADALRRAYEALAKSGTHMLGVVLNKLSKRSGSYYYYYYYYTHEGAAPNGSPIEATGQRQRARRGRRS